MKVRIIKTISERTHDIKEFSPWLPPLLAIVLSLVAVPLIFAQAPGSSRGKSPAQPLYRITEIAPLPGGDASIAWTVSDSEHVAGWTEWNSPGASHGFVWYRGVTQELPGAGIAYGVNNRGTAVGFSDSGALLWNRGTVTNLDLGVNPPAQQGFAYGINDSDEVTGNANFDLGERPFIYSHGVLKPLPIPSFTFLGFAYRINNSGQIAGEARDANGFFAATWKDGTLTLLPSLPGYDWSVAVGINDSGVVVGYSSISGVGAPSHAIAWVNGIPRDLGLIGGWKASFATEINNQGVIVGQLGVGDGTAASTSAFLYANGAMYDLQNLLVNGQGWDLGVATSINNKGQIVGYGDLNGKRRGFLLTPER